MHRESVERSHARHPLVVGDRLDTDIEGANRVGCASMLVLTGVTSGPTLLDADPGRRPTYLAAGLDGLLVPHPAPRPDAGGWTCAGWTAGGRPDGEVRLVLDGSGDPLDALRALCAAAWSTGAAGRTGSAGAVRPAGAAAKAALDRLDLAGRPAGAVVRSSYGA
jgi:hypothetical protein